MEVNKKNKRSSKAFTLIELLMVISVIALLAAITLNSLRGARESARISNALSFQSQVHSLLGADLVAWWNFDDTAPTTTFRDLSGGGNTGTCTGLACPTSVPGVPGTRGTALSFDGVDDMVSIGIGTRYFPLPSFTICSWVQSPGLSPSTTWVRQGIISITFGLTISLDSTGRFHTHIDNGSTYVDVVVPDNLHDNRFHNLCVSHNGTTRIMFINGVNRSQTINGWLGTTRWPTVGALIGCEMNNCSIARFNGLIDDVRIYSRALTASEIQTLYAQTRNKYLTEEK